MVNLIEQSNPQKFKRHLVRINGMYYYKVIGKGAFGQVFMAGCYKDREKYDECHDGIKDRERWI